MEKTPPFRVELLRPCDGVAVVALQGEVDIHSASQFKGALFQTVSEGARRVIIDLTKVCFMDSTALGVVVSGLKAIKVHGGGLDIVCPKQSIRGILAATGLDQVMGIYHSRRQALAAAER